MNLQDKIFNTYKKFSFFILKKNKFFLNKWINYISKDIAFNIPSKFKINSREIYKNYLKDWDLAKCNFKNKEVYCLMNRKDNIILDNYINYAYYKLPYELFKNEVYIIKTPNFKQ